MTEMKDVYSRITGKIVADLERGVRPWFKRKRHERPPSRG